ncbi:MAG: hypothetical protein A3E16_02385 [Candidatus Blackburnbacteria bacterium RIFCSPHIGHO2_12_FULL_44_25]|nr:MAG: hypothetical protein A3E16_02385 [Candidatus Blackburnbacteria bacterium RIFCSPHIGHO2_12_FULL_44_25]
MKARGCPSRGFCCREALGALRRRRLAAKAGTQSTLRVSLGPDLTAFIVEVDDEAQIFAVMVASTDLVGKFDYLFGSLVAAQPDTGLPVLG